MNNYLSTNIKFLRQKKGLKQEELATIVDKKRSSISLWESDNRGITTEDIIKLSEFFDVPMDVLISKDLRIKEEMPFDELDLLWSKYKDDLTEDGKEMIKFMLLKKKKEIDEQLGGKEE